ncbi:GNAT family N-acetyltransferase [Blastococcus sp. SYSU D00695]
MIPDEMDLSGVDLTTEVVRTDRLVLRPHRPDDADAVFAACQDPDIQHWWKDPRAPRPSQARAGPLHEGRAPAERAEGRGMPVAVETGGVLVGSAGVHFRGGRLGPEIGYWLAPQARGNGYAAEVAHALAEWALGLGAPRVHLVVDVANSASQVTAERAGFRREGVVRACLAGRSGVRSDAVLFGRVPGD